MKLKKENIRNLIKTIVFLTLMFNLFLGFTYLMRNTERSTRGTIVEYYEEEENSLDVVFIGASNINRYWDPLRAWKEYGFTSRNYAPTGMHVSTYLSALKSALRTQQPQLVVLEARGFIKFSQDNVVAEGPRKLLDSLDYDYFRLKEVSYLREIKNLSWEESLPFYIDLIQYHDNYKALITSENWFYADNRVGDIDDYEDVYKGYLINSAHAVFYDPSRYLIDKNGELDKTALKLYTDIIEYCDEEEIPLLIVASPLIMNRDYAKRFNSLEFIAEIYGVDFLNTNNLYQEMGIDFTQDFYDKTHVNVLGANKFTDYLASYIVQNYELPDHRGDSMYEEWDVLYESYIGDKESAEQKTALSIQEYLKSAAAEIKMCQASDIADWIDAAKNPHIALFLVANENLEGLSLESKMLLKELGATESYLDGTKTSLKALYNNGVQYSDSDATDKKGTLGEQKTSYVLATEEWQITVGKKNYFDQTRKGIQIVAVNLYSGKVFDGLYLSAAEKGTLNLEHLNYEQ